MVTGADGDRAAQREDHMPAAVRNGHALRAGAEDAHQLVGQVRQALGRPVAPLTKLMSRRTFSDTSRYFNA